MGGSLFYVPDFYSPIHRLLRRTLVQLEPYWAKKLFILTICRFWCHPCCSTSVRRKYAPLNFKSRVQKLK